MRLSKRVGRLILIVCCAASHAQEFRATITGRVLDSSGAAVTNVVVQVRNVGTSALASTITDAQGHYAAPFLSPGAYVVTVEAQGFKKFTREGLTLSVGQTATVDVQLELGAVADSVTVTASTPLLETAKADRGVVIDGQSARELPLNGRNPFMLSILVPGVQYGGSLIFNRPFDNGAISVWSVNGGQPQRNEFLLDGAPNNSMASGPFGTGNNIAYVPPVDAVQEFKIQTNSYDAQYGRTGGGIVNVSLKSGTNTLHGTSYEFARRTSWDANTFQNNARGTARSPHTLDQWGFQLDGPVYIPRFYDGRNRTFFMVSFEKYDEASPQPLNRSVPEGEMRDGDFSKLADAQGRRITIYDPTTGRDVNGVWTRDPFPGNRIPGGRINPIARRILDYMPLPNTSTLGAAYSQANLFSQPDDVETNDFYNLALKFDQNIRDKHRLFFRYARNAWTEFQTADNGFRGGPGENGGLPLKRDNSAYVADWTAVMSPTLILNLRGSFNRFGSTSNGGKNVGFDKTTLGFPSSLVSQLPSGAWFGQYAFDGYITLGRHFDGNWSNTFAAHPSLTKIQGGHTMKAGVDMRWPQYATRAMGQPFFLQSGRNFTQREFNRADALSGDGIATWLLGTPSSGRLDNNIFAIHLRKYYAPYFQDDWRITSRLTVNLGIRFDFNVSFDERYNRLNRGFDSSGVNPADLLINRTVFPDVSALKGGLLFAGANGVPRTATDLDKLNLQPRFGIAYRLTRKLVMRGGWGRYYQNPDLGDIQSNGFSQATLLVPSNDGDRVPTPNLLNNPFPNGVQTPPGNSLGLTTFLGRNFSFANTTFELPYVNQFSLGFQYELPMSSKLEVSYVGSRSKKVQSSRPLNNYDLAFRQKCNLMEGGNPLYCDQRLSNPFRGLEPFAGTNHFTDTTLSRAQLAQPYPHFGALTEVYRNDGRIWYNSLQLTYESRLRAGLNISATYTLSKMVEENGFNDVQNNILSRGLSEIDRPHRVVFGGVYELPFGKGKPFLAGGHGLWNRLIGGWQTSALFIWQSGQPWALPANVSYIKEAKAKDINWSAHQVYGVRPCVARWNDSGTITMQSYSVATGCTDYNFLINPRYAPRLTPNRDGRLRMHTAPQLDVSLNKTTHITERIRVQFRAEAFNVSNTYTYSRGWSAGNLGGQFINNPENANFGSIIPSTVNFRSTNFPRNIQLAVKVIW